MPAQRHCLTVSLACHPGPSMAGEYASSLETLKVNLREFGLGHHLEAGRMHILKVGGSRALSQMHSVCRLMCCRPCAQRLFVAVLPPICTAVAGRCIAAHVQPPMCSRLCTQHTMCTPATRLHGSAAPPPGQLPCTNGHPLGFAVPQGWFNQTLPGAPVQRIAFLRLDGDL